MTYIVTLSARKVLKHFGQYPHRGKALPCLPKKRVTVGLRWSLPHQQYVPDDDVRVSRMVALHNVGGDRWRVVCDAQFVSAVLAWLRANCT